MKYIRLKDALLLPLSYGLNEAAKDDNPEWPRYIRITDFDDNDHLKDDTFCSIAPEIAEQSLLLQGDILLARSGATVGKAFCFNENIKACYAGYLIRARLNPKKVLPKYFLYVTKSIHYIDWKNRVNIQSTIQNISAERYNQYEFPCPSLLEQQTIVDYLNGKTEDIDNHVSLLTSKRDAYLRLKKSIINNAVTKGLSPYVKMKDSVIDWIGEIPEHWNKKRLKDCVTLTKGRTPTNLTMERIDLPYLTMDYLRDREGKDTMYPKSSDGLLKVAADEILVLWDGANAGEFILSKEGYLGSTMALVECKRKAILKSYLFYLLKGIESDSKYYANGTTIPHFDASTIMSREYPMPPIEEQSQIAAYLNDKCSKIDTIVENLEKQITRFADLKRALIDEVITGKRIV